MTSKTKRRIIVGSILLAAVLGIVVFASTRQTVPEYSSEVVRAQTFVQSVEETGVIDTQVSITYGWETSGRIVSVTKEVGDMVTSSDIIAELDDRTEVNQLRQAQSQLAGVQARLSEALADPTEEDKAIYEARIAGARASLSQAESDLLNTRTTVAANIADAERTVQKARTALQQTDTVSQSVLDAYSDLVNVLDANVPDVLDAMTAADNILGIDNEFANDEYDDILGVQSLSTLNAATNQYMVARSAVTTVDTTLGTLNESDLDAIDAAATTMQTAMREVNELLALVLDVLDATPPIGDLSQSELDALQTAIITQKTSITAAKSTLTNSQQAVASAKNATATNEISLEDAIAALQTANRVGDQQIASAELVVEAREATLREAEANYDALLAPPRAVDVAALRADVSRYASAVEAAQTAVDDMVLRALADGTITMLDVSVGETVSPNQDIVTIQSNDRKIEVDISESDIAKIAIGDTAIVMLDAYDDVELSARVTKIDPAATEISGVVYYKTTLEVTVPEDLDVRPGMTADVQIITEEKPDTIALPRRAVLTREDGSRYVRVLTDAERAQFEERTVRVGLSGDDGLVEILSGITAGEEVITFIEE